MNDTDIALVERRIRFSSLIAVGLSLVFFASKVVNCVFWYKSLGFLLRLNWSSDSRCGPGHHNHSFCEKSASTIFAMTPNGLLVLGGTHHITVSRIGRHSLLENNHFGMITQSLVGWEVFSSLSLSFFINISSITSCWCFVGRYLFVIYTTIIIERIFQIRLEKVFLIWLCLLSPIIP
jgi:hypothetical protein